MRKILISVILLSSFTLIGCGAGTTIEKQNEETKIEKQEISKEESINNLITGITKGTVEEVEKGFLVVKSNIEDKTIKVDNYKDIDGELELTVNQALEIYDKIQYVYYKDKKAVAIIDYTKDSIKKEGNIFEKSKDLFIDPTFK